MPNNGMGRAHFRLWWKSAMNCCSSGVAITRSIGGWSRMNSLPSVGRSAKSWHRCQASRGDPVQSTAETDPTGNPAGRHLGDLAAIGTASFQGHGFTKSFTEHCILLGLVNVRADLTYQQGIDRMFSRRDRLDFFWPALSHLGEQEVFNKEIFAQDLPAWDWP